MDETDESLTTVSGDVEVEIKEMMGLFDVPAFARRGQELEETLRRLDDRCRQARAERLDMVHVRLRQWARAATGPDGLVDRLLRLHRAALAALRGRTARWAAESAPIRRQSTSPAT